MLQVLKKNSQRTSTRFIHPQSKFIWNKKIYLCQQPPSSHSQKIQGLQVEISLSISIAQNKKYNLESKILLHINFNKERKKRKEIE